jgi:hypothetical protein
MLTLKTKLGDLLISKGLLTAAEFDSCLEESKLTGTRVGEVLIQKGYLTEDQVYRAISEQQGLDFIDLRERDRYKNSLQSQHFGTNKTFGRTDRRR